MFTAHPSTTVSTLVALPDPDGTLVPRTVVDPVPPVLAGSRSIAAPVVPFRGLVVPAPVVRATLRLERERRAGRRAAATLLASARPMRGHPVKVRHDGTNAFERSIIVTAARIRADRNAARFGTARFGR